MEKQRDRNQKPKTKTPKAIIDCLLELLPFHRCFFVFCAATSASASLRSSSSTGEGRQSTAAIGLLWSIVGQARHPIWEESVLSMRNERDLHVKEGDTLHL